MCPRRALLVVMLAAPACAEPAPLPPRPLPAPPPPPLVSASASAPEIAASTAPPPVETASASAPIEPPPPPPPPPQPRLVSLTHLTRIFARPKVEDRYLGYVGFGGSLRLRATETVPGEGCRGGFYPVEPRGFVCKNSLVSLTPSPKQAELAAALTPANGPLPFQYAYSDGVPSYNKVPTLADGKRLEGGYGPAGDRRTLPKNPAPYDDLATLDPIPPTGPMPGFLAAGGGVSDEPKGLFLGDVPAGNMMAFQRAFTANDRTFLLTTEQILVPADRVRLFRPSTYQGVRLDATAHLPLAFVRIGERHPYRRMGDAKTMVRGSRLLAPHSRLTLTGVFVETPNTRYWETDEREPDGSPSYVSERDAGVFEAETALPQGIKADQKWIAVSLGKGTLVAYEGQKPVYATLISPGAGGAGGPSVGKNLGTTPLGAFALTIKHRYARMTHEPGAHPTHYISDVPYVQYFNPPFALHAAYWHDRFGEPTSAGCINLSPIDAEALFAWSDPQVPDDWQGALGVGAPENGKVTVVVIRR
ncbi:MAG: L,D-transpeptidase [Byssovorax sp.]